MIRRSSPGISPAVIVAGVGVALLLAALGLYLMIFVVNVTVGASSLPSPANVDGVRSVTAGYDMAKWLAIIGVGVMALGLVTYVADGAVRWVMHGSGAEARLPHVAQPQQAAPAQQAAPQAEARPPAQQAAPQAEVRPPAPAAQAAKPARTDQGRKKS